MFDDIFILSTPKEILLALTKPPIAVSINSCYMISAN